MLLALVLWTFFCLWHSRCSLVCRLVKVQEKNVFNFPFWRQMPVKFCGVEDFPCVNEKSERNVIFWTALTRCGRAAGRRQAGKALALYTPPSPFRRGKKILLTFYSIYGLDAVKCAFSALNWIISENLVMSRVSDLKTSYFQPMKHGIMSFYSNQFNIKLG